MDRDRKSNTRCTWFTQIGYVHGIEEFSLIVDVAYSLEVLFLHPGVVSVTGGDAQGLVKCDTNHVVGVPQVAELGDLLKEVTDKSIRPTEEFEGQNKSIKSRVRSTLLIWDTFVFDRVVDVSARVLLRLSPHASLYPSHLPYLFLRQMRYLPWKHKMLKMSTREQCQWELPASHVLTLSEHFEKVVCVIWKADVACEDYRQALSKEIQLLKLGKWCLFDFRTSNPVGDLALEIRRTMPLRFLRKQSCWGSGSRDSESGVSSIFEKVIMLGVWLSRFGGRCLFDFGASNLVGSVFSNMSKGWACLLVYLATKHRG
ncbi:hypothetical protein FF2_040387 [Malus domestica]